VSFRLICKKRLYRAASIAAVRQISQKFALRQCATSHSFPAAGTASAANTPCMSSTRKLARLAAPVVCAAYVTYVAVDRGYYHIERRKELDAAKARAKAEAARRVAADERR